MSEQVALNLANNMKQLREARGSSSIYHKNAIHTWRLHDSGKVTNVQIS